EVCSNMCWGVHCTSAKYSTSLTLDRSGASKRRRTAGCTVSVTNANPSGKNRCRAPGQTFGINAKGQPSHNCDEFPFASTREADRGGQINRCVLEAENSKLGNALKAFYRGRVSGDKFQIAFGNPNTVSIKYCVNPAGGNVCKNDNNIFVGTNGPAADPASFTPKRNSASGFVSRIYLYRTKLGREVSSAALFEPGRPLHVYVASRNATMEGEVELEMDKIKEII
ncbi:hypothetical protein BKA64DRAFT_587530, partial [Cadophora sp. MPI-SDFR-AT-0126]